MPTRISELSLTLAAIDKLGARAISVSEVRELLWNGPVLIRNPAAGSTDRRLLLGRTNGGRCLTLVIEATDEPTTWLVVTGWESSPRERKIIEGQS
ncbi:MAG: DUF4258 domain-containing protein [Solirubrobacteraceae bacterium]